jgi:hypothetical protein
LSALPWVFSCFPAQPARLQGTSLPSSGPIALTSPMRNESWPWMEGCLPNFFLALVFALSPNSPECAPWLLFLYS